MRNSARRKGFTAGSLLGRMLLFIFSGGLTVLGFACILAVFGVIGLYTWPYTIETWVAYAGKPPVNIAPWKCFLMGFCPLLGQFSIVAAVVTWILMMIL